MLCAEVVPQGTFSCGYAAIHLAAPYGMVCAMIFSIAFGLILCYDIACGSHF